MADNTPTDNDLLQYDETYACWFTRTLDDCGIVAKSLYDAQSILAAVIDDTPVAVTVAEQTIVGRKTSGNIDDLSASDVRTILGLATTDSPVFVTAKLTGLADGKIPYHVNDATGLADGPTKTDVDDAVTKKHAIGGDTTLGAMTADINMNTHAISGVGEIQLIPKASSTGAEGTIFYCSADNQVYVGTE